MSRYVDGFVIPIKKKDLKAYKKMAIMGKKAWLKHGALDYYECVGEDYKTMGGIPFPKFSKLKPNETVVFAFIVFKSKAHRNSVNKKVHKEMADCADIFASGMPFDPKRFTYAGFKAIVHK